MSDSTWWFHSQTGFEGNPKKTRSDKNRRKKCVHCGHSTTLNQRKGNGDKCQHCKELFPQVDQVKQYS